MHRRALVQGGLGAKFPKLLTPRRVHFDQQAAWKALQAARMKLRHPKWRTIASRKQGLSDSINGSWANKAVRRGYEI